MASNIKSRVFLRADGNSKLGLGHIVRCLAIADMLSDSFQCIFILNYPDQSVVSLIEPKYPIYSLKCANNEAELGELKNFVTVRDIFVTDGYEFDEAYQSTIKKIAFKLVMLDDKAEQFFYADVIFNHGDVSVIPVYRTASYTKVYTGLDYLIVRKEFLEAASKPRVINKLEKAFICMGGADPYDITIKAVKAVHKCGFINKLTVVTGIAYRNSEQIKILTLNSGSKVEYIQNVTAARLVQLLGRCDLAITTASSIALEVCCVKSALLCGTVIDNQFAIHEQLLKTGCCHSVGDWKTVSEESIVKAIQSLKINGEINKIIATQSKCIDGESSGRIRSVFKQLTENEV